VAGEHDCKHPPATPTADGLVRTGLQAWCSHCGCAMIGGQWVRPQQGKAGKCHPSRGNYFLPSLEQYVAAGYSAANYQRFIAGERSPAPAR